MTQLFTLPIPRLDDHPGGALTCTTPSPAIYVLTLTSPPDNRLTTPVLQTLLTALDLLEFSSTTTTTTSSSSSSSSSSPHHNHNHPRGVVALTSGIPKFFSNGLDLAHAVQTDGFWALLYSVWRRLLTYPMPTVALCNGHAFAGGLMLAMACDYRLAPAPRGFMCLNELVFGAPLKPAMAALFRHKVPATTYRALVLEAHRFTGPQAVEAGLADGLAEGGVDALLEFVAARDLVGKPQSGVYGTLKAEMYKDLLVFLQSPTMEMEDKRFDDAQGRESDRREFGKVWYEEYLKENKAKL